MSNTVNAKFCAVYNDHQNNTENNFLGKIKESNKPVKIYLIGGCCLSGVIADFDENLIKLVDRNGSLIVYKTAIASISLEKIVSMQEADARGNRKQYSGQTVSHHEMYSAAIASLDLSNQCFIMANHAEGVPMFETNPDLEPAIAAWLTTQLSAD